MSGSHKLKESKIYLSVKLFNFISLPSISGRLCIPVDFHYKNGAFKILFMWGKKR